MSKETKTYRAILRDVAQLIVGEVVKETKTTLTLLKPSLLNVQGANGSVNLQFIPLELVSFNPPLMLKALLADDKADDPFEVTFIKDQLIQSEVALKEDIFAGYIKSLEPQPSVLAPPNAGGLVGPNGAPLADEVPKIQDLF